MNYILNLSDYFKFTFLCTIYIFGWCLYSIDIIHFIKPLPILLLLHNMKKKKINMINNYKYLQLIKKSLSFATLGDICLIFDNNYSLLLGIYFFSCMYLDIVLYFKNETKCVSSLSYLSLIICIQLCISIFRYYINIPLYPYLINILNIYLLILLLNIIIIIINIIVYNRNIKYYLVLIGLLFLILSDFILFLNMIHVLYYIPTNLICAYIISTYWFGIFLLTLSI